MKFSSPDRSKSAMSRFWKIITGFLFVIAVIHVYEKVFGPPLETKEHKVALCKEPYELKASSRILVTGAAGFIGMTGGMLDLGYCANTGVHSREED